jgi:hypothetical protein
MKNSISQSLRLMQALVTRDLSATPLPSVTPQLLIHQVMAGLVPAIPIDVHRPCLPDRDRRVKPGDDDTRVLQAGITRPILTSA